MNEKEYRILSENEQQQVTGGDGIFRGGIQLSGQIILELIESGNEEDAKEKFAKFVNEGILLPQEIVDIKNAFYAKFGYQIDADIDTHH